MRILFVSPFPYGKSSGQGGAQICFNAHKILNQKFELGVVCFSGNSVEENLAETEMSDYCSFIRVFNLKLSKFKVLYSKIFSLVTNTPEHSLYFKSENFKSLLLNSVNDFEPDVVITQFPQIAQYLPFIKSNVLIQDIQDAFSVSWYRRYESTSKFLKKYYAKKQWLNWVAYEAKYYRVADQCWTLSEQDKFGLLAFNPSLNVVSVGLPLFQNISLKLNSKKSEKRVGFIGSYNHPPNIEALEYILLNIAPKLDDVEFIIAGRNPPKELVKVAGNNVNFIGFVETLTDFYENVSVVIAPLLSGGGVKVKVAEALSYGKAVVTTSVGADGLDYKKYNMMIVENEFNKFTNSISELLLDDDRRLQLEHAALEYSNYFSFDNWLSRVESLIDAQMTNNKNDKNS